MKFYNSICKGNSFKTLNVLQNLSPIIGVPRYAVKSDYKEPAYMKHLVTRNLCSSPIFTKELVHYTFIKNGSKKHLFMAPVSCL